MTPTQEDHEAAARLHMSIASAAHAYYADHGEPCQGCIFIAAALSEAVRVAVEGERERHTSMAEGDHFCRQCERLSAQTVIDSMRSDAQATPAPEPVCKRCGNMHACGCGTPEPESMREITKAEVLERLRSRGTPPETGEK